MASSRLRPLSSCRVCRWRSRSFERSSLRRLASWILSVSFRCVPFDDFLLLADLLGLFFQGVLALVEEAFPLVEFAAQAAELLFALRPGPAMVMFLDFQLGLATTILHVLVGPADDFLGFRFGVSAPQMIQQLDQQKVKAAGKHGRDNHGDYATEGSMIFLSQTDSIGAAAVPRPASSVQRQRQRGLDAAKSRCPAERVSIGGGQEGSSRKRVTGKIRSPSARGRTCSPLDTGPRTWPPNAHESTRSAVRSTQSCGGFPKTGWFLLPKNQSNTRDALPLTNPFRGSQRHLWTKCSSLSVNNKKLSTYSILSNALQTATAYGPAAAKPCGKPGGGRGIIAINHTTATSCAATHCAGRLV